MKKLIAWLLTLAMVFTFAPFATAFAEDNVLYLPTEMTSIEDEAFAGDTSLTAVFIPENVTSIGAGAFSGCTGLTEVIFNTTEDIEIATDAFSGCGDIHFIVFPDTKAELFALAHGYACDRAVPGSTFFERIKGLVAEHGGTSALQSDFDSMRLIVRRSSNRLPDISAYNPTEIVRRGDVFIIQFDSEPNTRGCYGLLYQDLKKNGGPNDFVEVDCCVTANFTSEVSAAGVIDSEGWGTDDPMGFDVYAPFVAEYGIGAATIAVIDSGVEVNSSYAGKLNYGLAMNMVEDEESWTSDRKGHGSYIASVIDECTGDANVSILPIRVVGNSNTFSSANVDYVLLGNAILYAVECGANIINLSMSFTPSAYVEMCINEAISKGVAVVVSAGNVGADISSGIFPANLPQVITVAGLQSNHTIAGNYGSTVDYVAPYSLFSTALGVNRGTSFSAPMIASALALVSIDPNHNVEDMNGTCINGNETGSGSNSYGYGMPQLDLLAAIPVTGLKLDSSMPAELAIGSAIDLKWTVTPANATNRTVTVSSSDDSVLSVQKNDDGTITLNPLKKGSVTVTVTSDSNSNLSVSRTFTVVKPITSITILGAEERLAIGRPMSLSAVIEPEDASTPAIEWISSNPAVASVSEYGTVLGKSEGVVGIYAKAKDGYGAQSETVYINVIPIPDVEGLTLKVNGQNVTNSVITMQPDDTLLVETSISPDDADQNIDYKAFGNNIQTSKTDNSILVTAVSSGTAYLEVSATDNKNITAQLEIRVLVPPTSVQITGETVLNEGETTALSATVLPDNADNKTVSWKSSDESVATVTSGGLVMGVKDGTAIITATANGDANVKATVTVTVRHPYVIYFDSNRPETELSPSLSATSKSAFSGYEVGELPTASCDYYYFQGWFTAPSGGEKVTNASKLTTTDASVTLYAHWLIHEESAWVLTSSVPSGARVTATSYSYSLSTESTASSMSGWTSNGNYWKQTGSGSKEYASFPSTYNTSHSTYKSLNGSAYTEYENETSKRTVSNSHTGYVYWHWAYNVAYANNTNRWISDRKQTAGSSRGLSDYVYKYFYAFKSKTNASTISGFTYTWGANGKYNSNATTYNCSGCLPSGADKSATSGLATPRFLRLNYYTSSYTDYTKYYKYTLTQYYANDYPVAPSGVKIDWVYTYVKYRVK